MMGPRIALSLPVTGQAEQDAVLEALRSGWITSAGPQLDRFEQELAVHTGRRCAVAVSSGTAALHLALLAAGAGPGDLVPCSTLTFAATANAICYTGATPVFIDSDATGSMDVSLLDAFLTDSASAGARVGAVVPVDLFGKIADHAAICRLADRYGVPVVVDAAESLGSVREGRPAGSDGRLAILSFNGNKILTASAGGAVVCDDPALADRVRHLATQARQPVVHYEHEDIGFNYRLSNLLAAVGSAQLARLPEFLAARRAHREGYRRLALTLPGVEILGGEDTGDNCWLTAIVIDPAHAGFDADEAREALASRGIESRPVWKPMHLQPVFADPERYPRLVTGVAEHLFTHGLVLPSGPSMSPEQRAEVERCLSELSRAAHTVDARHSPGPAHFGPVGLRSAS